MRSRVGLALVAIREDEQAAASNGIHVLKFKILAFAAPVLIIAAILINYRTVLGYLRLLWDTLRRRPLLGILGILLTVIGFPVVSGFLFGKAILDRKIDTFHKEIKRRQDGELISYEDVTEEPGKKEVLELKTPPPQQAQPKNIYDEFFEVDGKDGD
jgi:ABC-type branched-subunit amino acid transport system permease subunit